MNSSMTFEDARVHYTVLKQQPDTTRGNQTQPSDHYSHAGNLRATHHNGLLPQNPKAHQRHTILISTNPKGRHLN